MLKSVRWRRLLAAAVVCLVIAGMALAVISRLPHAAKAAATTPGDQLATNNPVVPDYAFISASTTPPTEAQCESVGRRCFTPQAIQSAYNLGLLYQGGKNGAGMTIAIVDSYGSDTMAHDLHVFDQ